MEQTLNASQHLAHFHPARDEGFRSDVIEGLSRRSPSIPPKYFYDQRGSQLFEQITEQQDYYPTRAETELLIAHASDLARAVGPRVDLIELGSGSSTKTRLLLDALEEPLRYVPVDISAEHLLASAAQLQRAYPHLRIEPVVGDYSTEIHGIRRVVGVRRVVTFLGSSIGNFEPDEAVAFLRRARVLAGRGGAVWVGIDLPKERAILERAYDDRAGVTAAFNVNLLHRMRRELGADVDPSHFRHAASWDAAASRVEMRLVASRPTAIDLGTHRFEFSEGEGILTERSYKHAPEAFAALAARADLRSREVFFDPKVQFSLHLLE